MDDELVQQFTEAGHALTPGVPPEPLTLPAELDFTTEDD